MALNTYSDVPLNGDLSGRFVPWIVALMVYLATMSLMVAFSVTGLINRWDTGFASRLTVEIPSSSQVTPQLETENAAIKSRIIQTLLKTPGIGSVHTLAREDILATLKPWLGEDNDISQLPLPTLLEVEVSERNHLNYDLLKKALKNILPTVTVEDHLGWQRSVLDLAYSAQIIGLLIVSMIILAAIGTIAFTSQTSLIIHRNVIEILYLVGATDAYIARQFQNHALKVGIRGGFVGFLLSAGTFLMLKFFARHLDSTPLDDGISTVIIWSIALVVPLFVTVFMMLAARFSVRLALKYVI
jgi:cell division transport system permease protein